MTSFLLLLSFLIHLLVFITIYHLYEKNKRDKDEQAQQIKEMLTEFMNDIRLENNKLEQKVYETDMRQNISYDTIRTSEGSPKQEVTQKEKYKSLYSNEAKSIMKNDKTSDVKFSSYLENAEEINPKEDIIETSIESQILRLYQEGKTVAEIAKQLNRGKTEVELLLKLNKEFNDFHERQ